MLRALFVVLDVSEDTAKGAAASPLMLAIIAALILFIVVSLLL